MLHLLQKVGRQGKPTKETMGSASSSTSMVDLLPENCISHILSLTTGGCCPGSDGLQEHPFGIRMRPCLGEDAPFWLSGRCGQSGHADPGYPFKEGSLPRLSTHPLIIDQGRRSFSIDRLTGKKCFMLSSRDLHIAWGGDARYWSWIALPGSRFPQVVELLSVCWLDIRGSMDTSELSPDTHYTVHCILKLRSDSYGFDAPVNLSLSTSNGTRFSSRSVFVGRRRPRGGRWRNLRPRNGGAEWMEIELGEFHTGEQGEVEFRLTETEMLHWKHGLVLEGFEIKPKQMNAQP